MVKNSWKRLLIGYGPCGITVERALFKALPSTDTFASDRKKWWRHLNFKLKYSSLESFITSKIRTKFRPQFTCSLLNLLALRTCWPENTCAGTRGRVMGTWGTAPGDVTWGRWVGVRRECGVESGVPSKKITNKLLLEITVAVYLVARTGLAHQLDRDWIRQRTPPMQIQSTLTLRTPRYNGHPDNTDRS